MSPWLKAGLVGGAVLVVLDVLGLIPCVGFLTCILGLVAYIGIGALAAYWMPPIREAGPAAAQGAGAAALAALIGGIVNSIITTVQWATIDPAELLSALPATQLQQWQEAGFDPTMFAEPGFGVAAASLCCLGGLIFAVILGGLGGAVFAGIKAD
jgi:hypothetical protein